MTIFLEVKLCAAIHIFFHYFSSRDASEEICEYFLGFFLLIREVSHKAIFILRHCNNDRP